MSIILYSYFFYIIFATIGATYGYHRYWAHKKFKMGVWYEWLTLTCGLFVGIYKPIGWIGIHRLHHKYSDTEMDPHSPVYRNKLDVLFSKWNTDIPPSIVKDIIRNPRIIFFQRYGKYLAIPVFIISPITFILGYVGMGVLNYFGHKNGNAINRWWINFFAPFEGNHGNHHK